MQFEVTPLFLKKLKTLISEQDKTGLLKELKELHPADIAEVLNGLEFKNILYIIKSLDHEQAADVLIEIDDDIREKILQSLTPEEIAEMAIDELDSDDAADIIAELPDAKKEAVISQIEDVGHAKDIVDLLRYPENTAGGLMGKELVKVNENWNVLTCVKEMRKQAENIERVYTIYVVDDHDILKGRLSLKSLLTTSTKTPVKDVYNAKVKSVSVLKESEEIAKIMQKYDLFVIPVVNELGRLVGQITIDDMVDVIREEADRDYQIASGISQDVEADDTIWQLTKARLPWLFIGMIGGIGAASIIDGFQSAMTQYPALILFIPLIQATAGNVGVQSSAIVVQGLANNALRGKLSHRLFKELLLGLVNGVALSAIIFIASHFFSVDIKISFAIGIALITVIIIAALIGTFIPIFLNKRGVDPAIATGPFITTSNDVAGILIYFLIAKLILGF